MNLRVSLKLSEKTVGYLFTRIFFMNGSHLCESDFEKEKCNDLSTNSEHFVVPS